MRPRSPAGRCHQADTPRRQCLAHLNMTALHNRSRPRVGLSRGPPRCAPGIRASPRHFGGGAISLREAASGDPMTRLPMMGSPSARSIMRCANRRVSTDCTGLLYLAMHGSHQESDDQGGVADRLDQCGAFGGQLRRLGDAVVEVQRQSAVRSCRWPGTPCPRRRRTGRAVRRIRCRRRCRRYARRARTAGCGARSAWPAGSGRRRAAGRRSGGRCSQLVLAAPMSRKVDQPPARMCQP